MQKHFPAADDLLNARSRILRVEVDNELDGLGLLGVQLQVLVDAHDLVREGHVVHGNGVVERARARHIVHQMRVVEAIEVDAVRGGPTRFNFRNGIVIRVTHQVGNKVGLTWIWEFPEWWAVTVATFCPSRTVEHVKSMSALPLYQPDVSVVSPCTCRRRGALNIQNM